MSAKFGGIRSIALAVVAVAVLGLVGGTAFAGGHPTQARAAHGVSKAQVKKIVKAYIQSHKAKLQGPKPTPIALATDSSGSSGFQTIAHIGPWQMQEECSSGGVGVQFIGSGEVFGTNTLGTTNGGAGSSFETAGPGVSFSAGTTAQGSQTVALFGAGGSEYTVTYFENADSSTPVDCDIAGYSMQIKAASS